MDYCIHSTNQRKHKSEIKQRKAKAKHRKNKTRGYIMTIKGVYNPKVYTHCRLNSKTLDAAVNIHFLKSNLTRKELQAVRSQLYALCRNISATIRKLQTLEIEEAETKRGKNHYEQL